MKKSFRALVTIAGLILALVVLGFFIFAGTATRSADLIVPEADGIVVLTGAEFRIAEGARLLERKRGQRLLITGVNPQVSRHDLLRITRLPPARLDCCVDVDTKALDTIGNAREAKAWAGHHGYKSVIIVTSNFHMPRSLTEFALAMPDVRLQAHPVVPRGFPKEAWWLHRGAARILLSEYLKFLPAALRLAASRTLGSWQSEPIAVTGKATQHHARTLMPN
ncbi:MAG: YdcF family protein [Hyphomicrobiaceae bacterium]|nr:YdcF family protein [Hyphomicrobiaceae bacterium]